MPRRHYVLALMLAVIVSLIFVPRALNSIRGFDKSSSQEKAIKGTDPVTGGHTFALTPWGPSQQTVDAARAGLPRNPPVLKRLAGPRFPLISFHFFYGCKVNTTIMTPQHIT